MARIRSAKTAAVLLAATGLGFGLIGSGVHATMTDGGSVSESVSVGSLHCAVSSTDPGAVVAGNSVTLQLPSIQSSAAGSAGYANVTVSNTGTMPEVVHWTTALSGLSSRFTAAPGTPSIASDVTLAVGANQPYSGFGFVWSTLSNPDLGTSGSVTYTANCGEVPPPPPPYSGPLTFTMGNANPTGPSVGPGNSFQIYGDIHNGATSGGVWKTMSLTIPFTMTGPSGDTLSASMITSYFGGTASVVGSNIVINVTNPYTNLTLFGPGGTKTGAPLAYIGANPTYGANVTFGTPYITAST